MSVLGIYILIAVIIGTIWTIVADEEGMWLSFCAFTGVVVLPAIGIIFLVLRCIFNLLFSL